MRFDVSAELRLFGESVRAAVGDWEPVREPELGAWLDDRDDSLGERLAAVGWHELWATGDPGPAVAGGLELGRALAPVCLLDEAALGAPLAVGSRIRHGAAAEECALARPAWGLARGRPSAERRHEPTLDGNGTVTCSIETVATLGRADAAARWSAWCAATLAYLAGVADAALAKAVRHARTREQFGRPLAAFPGVQARLADAALAVDGLALTAWRSAAPAGDPQWAPALVWAGAACREVTASAHQVHGALGFALESGIHRFYRRAKAVQVWAAAVCGECESG
jgi:hypothetical protein